MTTPLFAVQLCNLRTPEIVLGVDELPFPASPKPVDKQFKVSVESREDYRQPEQTL